MKLRINEYLFEGIADVRKYYPNIDEDTFMRLIQLDPTYRGGDSLGKYGKWILNLYKRGAITEEDFDEIPAILNQFTTYRNRIANKDLNFYKSLQDLSDMLASVIDDDSMLSPRQKVRFLKNVKAGRVKVSAEDDYDVVLDTPNFIVYVPNTHEASMKLGKGTQWCTAHENPEWFDRYTRDGKPLYIIKDKQTGKRWQYSEQNDDFLDENDEKFSIPDLMNQDAELSKFFEQFLGIDIYEFDGTFVYNGASAPDAPEYIRDSITTVIVKDGVEYIDRYAFSSCEFLDTVELPKSVKEIGTGAFMSCTRLANIEFSEGLHTIRSSAFDRSGVVSIVFPSSMKKVQAGAFHNCESLASVTFTSIDTVIERGVFRGCSNLNEINLPDGLEFISSNMFNGCFALTDITIPDSVRGIADGAFYDCGSLTTVYIPDGVEFIGEEAFGYCDNLVDVNIPESVVAINTGAFAPCKRLTSLKIPDSVESIGFNAFDGCTKLTVYTDNQYVIDYCNDYGIPVKPSKEYKIESIKRNAKIEDSGVIAMKLMISEGGYSRRKYSLISKEEYDYWFNVGLDAFNRGDKRRIGNDSKLMAYFREHPATIGSDENKRHIQMMDAWYAGFDYGIMTQPFDI